MTTRGKNKRTDLQIARKEAGFKTQASFAEKLGISHGHVTSLEAGRVNPSWDLANRICKILKKSPKKVFPDLLKQK